MPQQEIIWTALPNGLTTSDDRRLQLSVFVSPRLRFDDGQRTGTLSAFPEMLDWPARLTNGAVAFTVVADAEGATPINASVVTDPAPDSALWRALFDADTPVVSYLFERVSQSFSSPPSGTLAASVAEGYGRIGTESPHAAPTWETVERAFPEIATATTRRRGPVNPVIAARLRALGTLDERQLEETQSELAASLLNDDPALSFDEKLAAARAIAGRRARVSQRRAVPLIPRRGRASAMAEFAAFHETPRRRERNDRARQRQAGTEVEPLDFHQRLSSLAEYPQLLRRLGLVIDLEIPAELPQSLPGALGALRVEPMFTPPAATADAETPFTKYLLDLRTSGGLLPIPTFTTAPRASATTVDRDDAGDVEIVGGLLNLRARAVDDSRSLQFDLVQVDVDGAIKKLTHAMRAIAREEEAPAPVGDPVQAPAPSLRTSGISLVRSGRAARLMQNMIDAAGHEALVRQSQRTVFFAEDLVRGYRIDVRRFPRGFADGDPLPGWASLHERVGKFRLGPDTNTALQMGDVPDEGFVQPAIAQDPIDPDNPDAPNPARILESLFHWQGWSLSSPPPIEPAQLAPSTGTPSPPPSVRVEFEPKERSLPALRFGSHYQLRVRTVDLAGNSLSIRAADELLEAMVRDRVTQPIFPLGHREFAYQRYEPLAAPTLVPREEMTEGEAIDVMVIRSNGPGTTPASYAAALRDSRYSAFSERHVVPPKASQSTVEIHGMLDGAFGLSGEPDRAFRILRREDGSVNDGFVINLETGAQDLLPDFTRVDPHSGTTTRIPHGIKFVPVDAGAPGVPGTDTEGGYTIHYEEQLKVPYLPDPLAKGAALFGLPGVVNQSLRVGSDGRIESFGPDGQTLPEDARRALGEVTKIDFGSANLWPDAAAFRLQLAGTESGQSEMMPEWRADSDGRVLTVHVPPGEIRTIWISSYPDKSDIQLFGQHQWATTWWSTNVGGQAGERHFLNTAEHGALSLISPARMLTLVHAVQQPIIAPLPVASAPFAVDRMFAKDTVAYVKGAFSIHAPSTVKLDLKAAWRERGEGPDGSGLSPVETHVLEVPVDAGLQAPEPAPGTAPVAAFVRDPAGDKVVFQSPANAADVEAKRWLARHEFGDSKHRTITYEVVATTRYPEFFPERNSAVRGEFTRSTFISRVIVRSSARPPMPTITRIVPVFQWNEGFDQADVTRRTRRGGGLRVYLGERWYASGDGERLALVDTAHTGEGVLSGLDPLHQTRTPAGATPVRPTAAADNVTLEDGTRVRVFPYPVHYDDDAETKEWYADISFDVGASYFPFVALTLARYQEHSLPGCHLSAVVHAGIHQVAPDRTVTLEYSFEDVPAGSRRVLIKVFGKDNAMPANPPAIDHTVEVSLEERPQDHPGEDLGWTSVAPERQPVSALTAQGDVIWAGAVIVPRDDSTTDYRLVVREFELFPAQPAAPGQNWVGDGPMASRRRLVYADTIQVL